jgi:GNAT superfamily N-acetyltransferase
MIVRSAQPEDVARLAALKEAWAQLSRPVPDFHDRTRLTGDIQSVYVFPQHRQLGTGSALVRSLIDAADERGVPRVTVSANAAAASIYLAECFVTAPYLLERPQMRH